MDLILDVSQVVNHTLVEMRIIGELVLIAGFCGVASGEGVLSWGEVATVDGVASAQLLWQSDEHLAGFQFECDAAAFLAAGGGEVEELAGRCTSRRTWCLPLRGIQRPIFRLLARPRISSRSMCQ